MPFNRTLGQKDEEWEEGKKEKGNRAEDAGRKKEAVVVMIEGLVLFRSSEQVIVKKRKVIPVPEELWKQLQLSNG